MSLRLLFIAVGLVCLWLFVWFVTPLVSIAGVSPFIRIWPRIVLAALLSLVILWPWLRQHIRHRKNRQQFEKGLTEQDLRNQSEHEAIECALKQALETLRGTCTQGLFTKRRQHIYDLPWYILIGPPGAGKTTALKQSGLNFPLLQSQQTHSVKGVG
ncbi:MAG: hypothetical protein R3194_05350, partial [Limnobacter sp.]|nr:hypothetical protein [Limnobacter sp.]